MEKETVVEEIRRIGQELGAKRLSRRQFDLRTRLERRAVDRHFARWSEATAAAGLAAAPTTRVDDEDLFREMVSVFVGQGGVCRLAQFEHAAGYTWQTFRRHFGNWEETLMAFRRWLEQTGEPFPFLDQLTGAGGPVAARSDATPTAEGVGQDSRLRRCGQPLGFRGHIYEPINEQGVVALFGTVMEDLGFAIETVRVGYPDCEARRRIVGRDDLWQTVAIEFEFRSSGFRRAGHSPAACDLVVCWIHDWPNCPVEVLELREAIRALRR